MIILPLNRRVALAEQYHSQFTTANQRALSIWSKVSGPRGYMPSPNPFCSPASNPLAAARPVNPSEQVVRALDGQLIDGLKIAGVVLPVDQRLAPARLT